MMQTEQNKALPKDAKTTDRDAGREVNADTPGTIDILRDEPPVAPISGQESSQASNDA